MQMNEIDYSCCKGCVNLIKLKVRGEEKWVCKGSIIPETCLIIKRRKQIAEEKMKGEKMKKQFYKEELKKTLSRRLRILMNENNLNCADIERITKNKVSDASISNYLNRKLLPREDKLLLLSKLFDVTPDYLLGKSNFRKGVRNCNNKKKPFTPKRKETLWQKFINFFMKKEPVYEKTYTKRRRNKRVAL